VALYEYRRALDLRLDSEIDKLKDKLVEQRDYQKADELRGIIQGLQQAKNLQDEVLPDFLQVDYGDDDSEGLTDQA
jgi:hypothetical protein